MKLLLSKHKSTNDKIQKAQQKSLDNLMVTRQKTLEGLKKWDTFREEKEKYVDFVEKLLKDRVRIRTLNAIMQLR